MNTGRIIRKIVLVTMWVVIAGGITILLAAAMRKQKNERCRDYRINIKGKQQHFFADEKSVREMLITAANGQVTGQLLSSLNLRKLEQFLEENTWVYDAELYFDNRDVLHVTVTERGPRARIFTTNDQSFYIDSTGRQLPLSGKMSARVPVFTGFPGKKKLNDKDSLLLREVIAIAEFISDDPFWMAQVSQINITPKGQFEMIPVVGNHMVNLGSGDNIREKFRRLFVFYAQVLSQTGFERYKTIDVQYSGQVVATRQSGDAKVDSIQLRRNVEKLLQQARQAQNDSMIMQPVIPVTPDPVAMPGYDLESAEGKVSQIETQSGNPKEGPNAMKTISVSESPAKTMNKSKSVKDKERPKAVMPKKENGGLRQAQPDNEK